MSSKDETLDILKAENYLLGSATDDEALDLECEVFPDENLSEQLDSVRNGLSGKYIRNELNEIQKKQFENYFLSFPYNLQIFDFQKSLIEEFERREFQITPVEKKGILSRISEIFTTKMFAIPAFAALILTVFGGIFLYNSRNGGEIVKNATPTPAGEIKYEISPTPTRIEENINSSSIQNKNQSNDNSSNRENNQNKPVEIPAPIPKSDISQPVAPIIATVAFIGSSRTVGSKEKPIIVGKETEKLNLKFQYPEENSEMPVKNYKMILETITGNKIWEENLPKDGKKSGDRLIENISPTLLETGQYRFRVLRVFQDDKEETVQSQTFFVKRIS